MYLLDDVKEAFSSSLFKLCGTFFITSLPSHSKLAVGIDIIKYSKGKSNFEICFICNHCG